MENDRTIKIFISERIDVQSNQVDNPIYVPVRCGAIFDELNPLCLLGDDSKQNISSRRNSFCEFTVQYWAWKNEDADYYGLCHYRRYLTFSSKRFHANNQQQIMAGLLDDYSIKKYDLLNEDKMRSEILSCDGVVNEAADVNKIPTPLGYQKTVYNHWAAHDGVFIDKRVLPLLMKTIQRKFPQYYAAADEYMQSKWHRGYNCYVLRKPLFDAMCEFQFSVLFDLEQQLANNGLAKHYERTLGYMGEIMYGMFIHYLQKQGKYKIIEKQLVYFEQTVIPNSGWQRLCDRILFWDKFRFENVGYKILPKGSRRRNFIKKIYFSLVKR